MTSQSQHTSSAPTAIATATGIATATSTRTTAANHPFVDVLATFSQRLHAKSLKFFYTHYPELADHLDCIPRKVESQTIWTPKVRQAIILLAEALAVDLTQYAPFDRMQPFNDQGVRRMLPRLALLVAGRMKKEDAARRQLRYWLNQQRNREQVEAKRWQVVVHYSDGATGPAFNPDSRR